MKYLSDYTEHGISEALNKHGAFYAFSQKQLSEKAQEGVEYCSMGGGLICPKASAKQLNSDLSKILNDGISKDIAENGKEKIIERELYNHEAFYTGDIDSTIEAIEVYGYTVDDVLIVYNKVKKNIE